MTTAGSLSAHLVESYMSEKLSCGSFGQPHRIATHGAMSFAPQMHGTSNFSSHGGASVFGTQSSFFDSSIMEISEEREKKIATLQAKLDKKLGPEYISQRPGPGGGPKLTYAEGWKIINLANEVFGFNGWSSSVVNITTDFCDFNEDSRRYNVGVTAIVRVTLRDGAFHEDVGYGLLENSKSKGAALDKCKKEAVTDAVKRTLRNFGNLLGNCLYDKSYTQEVIKIKVPPPRFNRTDLHRRPEFEEPKPDVSDLPQASTSTSRVDTSSSGGPSRHIIKSEPGSSVMPPPSAPLPRPNAASTPIARGKAPFPNEPHTPLQTPGGAAQGHVPSHMSLNGGGMAQRTADRHAARLKAIQDAQEEAARAAVAATAESAQTVSTSLVPQVESESPEDEFHIPSEDDALYAAVDLDEGIGRPIDFDDSENVGVMEAQALSVNINIPPQHHGRSVDEGGAPLRPSLPEVLPQTSRQTTGPRQAYTSSTSTSSVNDSRERSKTPSMGGGFNFPAGQQPGRGHPPRSASHSGATNTGSGTSNLKRTAEIMQGIQSARRVQQGMGLQNPAGGSAVQTSGARREPLASLEVGDGGDVKRVRR